MSNGRLIIRIDSSNKHKSALGIFDFVKSGQYETGKQLYQDLEQELKK